MPPKLGGNRLKDAALTAKGWGRVVNFGLEGSILLTASGGRFVRDAGGTRCD